MKRKKALSLFLAAAMTARGLSWAAAGAALVHGV